MRSVWVGRRHRTLHGIMLLLKLCLRLRRLRPTLLRSIVLLCIVGWVVGVLACGLVVERHALEVVGQVVCTRLALRPGLGRVDSVEDLLSPRGAALCLQLRLTSLTWVRICASRVLRRVCILRIAVLGCRDTVRAERRRVEVTIRRTSLIKILASWPSPKGRNGMLTSKPSSLSARGFFLCFLPATELDRDSCCSF